MKSRANKLILTVAGTILLPIILFTIYEISSISESEKVIERAYENQLDAIIFSVNQYSNDNLSGIMDKIEQQLNDSLELPAKSPIIAYSNLHALLFTNLKTGRFKAQIFHNALNDLSENFWVNLRDSLDLAQAKTKDQLIRYKEGGYRKIEPTGIIRLKNGTYQLINVVLEHNSAPVYCIGVLSIDGFANNVLAPRLQQIADNELIITLGYAGAENFIYTTDSLRKDVMSQKCMWLLPTVEVGISSKNKTVKELVQERFYYNIAASMMLLLLLIFGFTMVYRNYRKEMRLAQNKSDFVSNVSHELRTPLALISMFAETLLLDRVANHDKRKEYEKIILKETNRLTNIVNKILNFSQIENNKRSYHPEPVNVSDVTKELLSDYAYHIERNGFTFESQLEADLPMVKIDKEALYEALVNLLDNAMKYSEDRKALIFRTGMAGDSIFVEVQDQGIGIPKDKINQIFDKFYRVTDGNIHTTRGAGLGLALVNHLMEAHGGKITVDSKLGKGTKFKLIFNTKDNGSDLNR